MADSKSTSPDQAGQNPAPSTGGFSLSGLCDHKTGWGPTQVELPDFNGVQFLPFNKSDRIGRVSELSTGSSYSRKGNYTQTFTGQPNIFQYQRLDDKDFKFVAKDLPKPRRRFGRKKFQNRSRFGLRRGRNPVQKRPGGRAGMAKRMSKRNRLRFQGRRRRYERDERIREPSIHVEDDWALVKKLQLSALRVKLPVDEGKTLRECGEIRKWDSAFDKVTPRAPADLRAAANVRLFLTTTSEDPIIQQLAEKKEGNIFITDTIAAALMCAQFSVYSFDVIVTKRDGMLFFDQRPASRLDQLTVNENWNEPKTTDKDNKHHPIKLSREATQINHHFNCQVVGSKSMSLGEKNPFADQMPEDEIPAPIGYRYRRWSLGGDRELVVRCEVNGYEVRKGKREVFVSRALNEWDSKESGIIDYRLKLETQSGAVLSAENRCNSNKIAKWAARALLSGAEQFKLGFVSRTNPKSNYAHQILLTQRFQTGIFANLIGVKLEVLWGAMSKIISLFNDQPDGTYLILRNPSEAQLDVHAVPEDAFDNDMGGEEDEMED